MTSLRKQDVTLIARHGIEAITALAGVLATPFEAGKADVDLHLPQATPVNIHLKLGAHKQIDWLDQIMTA